MRVLWALKVRLEIRVVLLVLQVLLVLRGLQGLQGLLERLLLFQVLLEPMVVRFYTAPQLLLPKVPMETFIFVLQPASSMVRKPEEYGQAELL
jgi:hypothetical protein